jgi:hypothetical protein
MKRTLFLPLLLAILSGASLHSATPQAEELATNSIYQYFLPSEASKDRGNLGMYLWIPPNTPKIRAIMVAMHNGLPINILQSAPVRDICRKHGIAQILITPWAKDIGGVMMKENTYDVTDPSRTEMYDSYIKRLADLSGHPELTNAPIVPLGHSAVCGFPFEAAIRNPAQCLATIPIKAGLPDVYKFFGTGGKALHPDPSLALSNVPILFVTSGSQETVSWNPYPHAYGTYLSAYRQDHDDNPGSAYQPHNELFSGCWEMMSGHFDMSPRNYRFVADWLDAIASARLPEKPGDPLKTITLKDGWLMNSKIPATGDLPKDYPMPAPYLEYKGHRNEAFWFPNEALARNQFDLGVSEPRKKIEMFTFLDPTNQPISLAMGLMAPMTNPSALLHDDGLFTLTTHRLTTPPEICTVSEKDRKAHPEIPLTYTNVAFPGLTNLPVSEIPFQFNAHGGVFEVVKAEQFKDDRGVTETRLTLRLKRHRIAPGDGFNMSFVRVFHEGDNDFAAAGRTCQISLVPNDAPVLRGAKVQTIDFPPVSDAPANTSKIELNAKSSAGLPVDYFVMKGPGIIRDGAFIPMEVPAGSTKPIEVTVGAYQVGSFREKEGVKPSATVYQTFHLIP